MAPVRYRSPDEDSARWDGFAFRAGDIVISTRSKSGTTWVQMICALLVFQRAELPAPLAELSPWVDWLGTPEAELYAQLDAQRHRRFVKTHTPLDGIPLDERATYIVVARHPLDMAVSLYHQGDNLRSSVRPPVHEWLRAWIDSDAGPRAHMDSLRGVLWHASDAWARRSQPNVVLVHYDDLAADLEAEMRRLASVLGTRIDEATWPRLVRAATFDEMRARADVLAPDPGGVLKDRRAFFRRGSSGAGREVLSNDELERYRARAQTMVAPDVWAWLHR